MAPTGTMVALPPPPVGDPDALYEFVEGEWKETPRMGAFAGLLASRLAEELNLFARPLKLGLAMAEVLFRLAPEGPARRPDVAYVAYERWPYAAPFEDDPPAFDVVPNLAVEVNSPSNGVTLDVLVTGRYPGSGKPGPIAYPAPNDVSEVIDNKRVVNLFTLVTLKLAARRHQDFADVVSLIRVHNLDESFADKLHSSLHRDYLECLEEKRREDEYAARETEP